MRRPLEIPIANPGACIVDTATTPLGCQTPGPVCKCPAFTPCTVACVAGTCARLLPDGGTF